MKFKIIVSYVLALSLFACVGNNTGSANQDNQQVDSPEQRKADFHKAALLNIEMGQTYLAQGQVSRAKQKFVHALELKPKLPEAHSAIGYFYETVGDIEEAETHYTQAIRYGGDKGRYYNNYGTFLCRQKRYREADRAFNNALRDKQYIKTAEVYENAGLCALQQPDIDKAYSYLKTAIKNDLHRSTASLELANIELNRQNLTVALYYLNLFKQVSQPTAKSLWISVQIYKQLGKRDEVASAALQLKSLYSDTKEYKQFLEFMKHE